MYPSALPQPRAHVHTPADPRCLCVKWSGRGPPRRAALPDPPPARGHDWERATCLRPPPALVPASVPLGAARTCSALSLHRRGGGGRGVGLACRPSAPIVPWASHAVYPPGDPCIFCQFSSPPQAVGLILYYKVDQCCRIVSISVRVRAHSVSVLPAASYLCSVLQTSLRNLILACPARPMAVPTFCHLARHPLRHLPR